MSEHARTTASDDLKTRLGQVTRELAGLNRDLAAQLIKLAHQTGDARPLKGAVDALRKVQAYYAHGEAPRESAEVYEALGDTLLEFGLAHQDGEAIAQSIQAYRSAITLTSLLNEDDWRRRLRTNYRRALAVQDRPFETTSNRSAA